MVDFLATAEGLHLNRAFAKIRDPKVRKRLIELVVAIASVESEEAEPRGAEFVEPQAAQPLPE